MTDHFRNSRMSSRAKNILDMVKEKPLSTSIQLPPNKNIEIVNNNKPEPGSADYIDSIYKRQYSMTGSVFTTFCETQTTFNSHHLLSLDIKSLKKESAFCEQRSTENDMLSDLKCYELSFDSDDSVLDKDYYPSDSSESIMSDVCERSTRTKKYRQLSSLPSDTMENPTPSTSTSANCFEKTTLERLCHQEERSNTDDSNNHSILPVYDTVSTNNFNLKRKRRNSICATSSETTSERSCPRRRSNTVDGNYCSSLPEILHVSHVPEIHETSRKRKKYDTPLHQRKLNAKNKVKSEHKVKHGCDDKCLKKCMTLFSKEDREAINKAYWDMSWQERHLFVEAHTYVATPKRKVMSEPKRKPKRGFVLKKQDGTKRDVCKIFFLTTLGYLKTNDRILHGTFSDPTNDRRGRHQKTPKFDRDLLTQHVELFNPVEHHYRREHAPLRKYLPSDINITQMHKHFCETNPNSKVSYSLYRQHVKIMNISFTDLGNEECELCEAYNFHKKETSHDANIQECTECAEWDIHHQKYTKARELYAAHKEKSQTKSQVFYSADLEKVIMLPRLEMFKAAIFCQRLIAYNQTFAPLGKITAEIKPLTVIWHDGIAGRKQEDIMSAFYHFFLRNRDILHIHIWLDNCSAQNKNWLLYSMLIHIINSENIASEKITLYYFEPGHTFMSSDQVHHQVELAMKKKGKLYDFTDFEECVSSINKSKVIVQSMSPENFLNIPSYVSQRRIQTSNPRAYLKNMVEVCFTRNSYDLMYKNNFNDETYTTLRFMNDKYLKNPRIMKFEFRTEPKCIEPKRKADILKNLSSIIPPHKLVFWRNLPTKENEEGMSSDWNNCID